MLLQMDLMKGVGSEQTKEANSVICSDTMMEPAKFVMCLCTKQEKVFGSEICLSKGAKKALKMCLELN